LSSYPTYTRRWLLELAASVGGLAGVVRAASALELMPGNGNAAPLQLARISVPRHVVIVGAGIAGLVSAVELRRAGYAVTVIEASHRLGGRVLTLRHGDRVDEIGNRQVCQFDREPHLYFNAGASRIPSVHSRILGYCAALGIGLETHVNASSAAWLQYDDFNSGGRVRQREFNADARGFIAELAARALPSSMLDAPLDSMARQQAMEFVLQFGDLDAQRRYQGSIGRAGSQGGGGLYDAGSGKPARGPEELLKADYWRSAMQFGESEAQSAVLQPIGGMDRITAALADQLPGRIELETQVIAIRTSDRGVEVTCRKDSAVRTIRADYCLNSMPGQILAGIDHNFTDMFQRQLVARPRGSLGKIALQMRERFWEQEGIYGGISWTSQDIGQIQYPSHGFGLRKGIVVGGYYLQPGPQARFNQMSAAERLTAAVQQGEKLHPGYGAQVENGISVAWHRMNHMLGCTARDTSTETLRVLRQAEGCHYLIGDQISAHAGWMEAAVLSAHDVLNRLNKRQAGTPS
jgi:monoamine oxidase